MPKTKPGEVQISVRMPEDLHRRLTYAASADLRSVNSYVVSMLRDKLSIADRDAAKPERKGRR